MADSEINDTGSVIPLDGTENVVVETVAGVTGHASTQAVADLATGGGGGSDLPIADPSSFTVDTTSYDNNVTGVGKLTTLVMPADTGVLAIALAGDAFPRWLFTANAVDGLYVSNGTYDPYAGAAALALNPSDGSVHVSGPSGQANIGGEILAGSGKVGFFTATPIVQQEDIPDAAGGAVVDVEARDAINAVLALLRSTTGFGFLRA